MKISHKNGLFFSSSLSYEERETFKKAGFIFHPGQGKCEHPDACSACRQHIGKTWWTRRVEAAVLLIAHADEEAAKVLRAHIAAVAGSRAMDADIDIPCPKNLTYYGYQRAGIKYMAERPATLLGDPAGVGKTIQILGLINLDQTIRNVLVVCPASLRINWLKESRKWIVPQKGRNFVFHMLDEDEALPASANFVIASYNRVTIRFSKCEACAGAGGIVCEKCKGTGEDADPKYACGPCSGKKTTPCVPCEGKGKLPSGNLTVWQSLMRRQWDLVAVDECFPYDTKIHTDRGLLPIGQIVESKMSIKVLSAASSGDVLEWRPIKRWLSLPLLKPLVRVQHEQGEFVCTADHKIWTSNRGYTKAGGLETSDILGFLRPGAVRMVRQAVHEEVEGEAEVLQQELLGEVARDPTVGDQTGAAHVSHRSPQEDRNQEPRSLSSNEETESNVDAWHQGEDDRCPEGAAFPGDTRRQRSTTPVGAEEARTRSSGVDHRVCGLDEGPPIQKVQDASEPLQDRYSQSDLQGCDRSRRSGAQLPQDHHSRSKEGGPSQASRVVDVEVLEPGDPRRRGRGLEPGHVVYDLEVEENHNYFAEGVLVSNCHLLKNPEAARTKCVVGNLRKEKPGITSRAKKKVFMSGTPLPNRPVELWPVLAACAPEVFGNYLWFTTRFCNAHKEYIGKRKILNVTGASHLDELQEKLRSTCMIRRNKSEVLAELPPKIRQIIELPVPPEAARLVDEELATFRSKYEDKLDVVKEEISLAEESKDEAAYHAAVEKLEYIQRVAFMEMAKVRHLVAVAKLPLCIEHVRNALEGGGKIVLFAHHKDVINAFAEEFKDECVVLFGETGEQDRDDAVVRFQTDPSVKLFVGGLLAAGLGLTLTASAHAIFAEQSWVPSHVSQGEDRLHRIGQLEPVLVHHLVWNGSLDAHMVKMLVEKQNVADQALDKQTGMERKIFGDEIPVEPVPPMEKAILKAAIVGLAQKRGSEAGGGFSTFDQTVGQKLATWSGPWSDRQAHLGRKLVRRYRAQVPEKILVELGIVEPVKPKRGGPSAVEALLK